MNTLVPISVGLAATLTVCGVLALMLIRKNASEMRQQADVKAFLNLFNTNFAVSAEKIEDAGALLPQIARRDDIPDTVNNSSDNGDLQPKTENAEFPVLQRLTNALDAGLALAQTSPSFPVLEQSLNIVSNLGHVIDLYKLVKIEEEKGDFNETEKIIDLCFVEGGFDTILTIGGFLDSYYSHLREFGFLRAAVSMIGAQVQILGTSRRILVDTPSPLCLISRSDPRATGQDMRGIARIPEVSAMVDKASISLHPEQAMVVDCITPQIIRDGRLLRKGRIVVYNQLAWI